jgi:UDP-N-acetyl-D-galactosamine dehydrogenase
MAYYAASAIVKRMLQNGINVAQSTVGVMGLTFKENCPDIRNSKVADLVIELQGWGVTVVVSDPSADPSEVQHEYGISLGDISVEQPVDSLIVAVGHEEFRRLSPQTLKTYCTTLHQPIIGDLKSLFDQQELARIGFTVFRL